MFIDRLLINTAERSPEKIAAIDDNLRASYGEILESSMRLAAVLQEYGLRRGDRVIIALDNSIEYLIAYFGVLHAGCVSVPINSLTSPVRFSRIIADCSPGGLITKTTFFRKVEKTPEINLFKCTIIKGDINTGVPVNNPVVSFDECIKHEGGAVYSVIRTAQDLASIIYTSGTTGEPKGVMLSHRNLVSNTRSILSYLPISDKDKAMVVLPFYYSYGNSLLLTHIMQGGTVVIDNSFIYPNMILERMLKEEVTGFAGVPSTFAILNYRSNFRNIELPSLRYITQAGGPMPHNMVAEFLKIIPHVKFYIMYGQTEASARLSYLPPEDIYKKAGSIGKAIPGVNLQVLNENGVVIKPGEVGEIVAAGENIMMGYWGKPGETAEVVHDGKLYTGDMATVDEEGYIYIVSRKKDIIKSGAYRITPREIEEIILSHPKVYEAAVVGKEDPILGEAICAFVVLKDGTTCTDNEIMRLCHENLPLYKIPRHIYFMQALPKTESGKIKKEELKTTFNQPEVDK